MNTMHTQSLPKQQTLTQPALQIASGTQFGHWGGLFWNRRPSVLVEACETISLQAGLHLLVAPNGAGKTTLMRTLAGLHPALSGRSEIRGKVHYVSDQLQFDGELSARDFFRAWFCGSARSFAENLGVTLGLNITTPIRQLSLGNRQKMLLCVAETLAAHSGPSLLLLDEPLAGMDAQTLEKVGELWAASASSVLRLVVLHELESIQKADSLFTVVGGRLRHARERVGGSWLKICQLLRAA
jgi:ABC-2 type transport system ATP-binding protein/manganese/iron transport system ATP-binding protein